MIEITQDDFVQAHHPISRIKPNVDATLARLSPLFEAMYSWRGWLE